MEPKTFGTESCLTILKSSIRFLIKKIHVWVMWNYDSFRKDTIVYICFDLFVRLAKMQTEVSDRKQYQPSPDYQEISDINHVSLLVM